MVPSISFWLFLTPSTTGSWYQSDFTLLLMEWTRYHQIAVACETPSSPSLRREVRIHWTHYHISQKDVEKCTCCTLIRSFPVSLLIIRRSIERIILTVRAEKSSLIGLLPDHGCLLTRPSSKFSSSCWENVKRSLFSLFATLHENRSPDIFDIVATARSNFNVDSVPDFTIFRINHRRHVDDFYVCWNSVTTGNELER